MARARFDRTVTAWDRLPGVVRLAIAAGVAILGALLVRDVFEPGYLDELFSNRRHTG